MKKKVFTITFRELRGLKACAPRYRHLAKALGGVRKYGQDTPITLQQAYEANGYDDVECMLFKLRYYHREAISRVDYRGALRQLDGLKDRSAAVSRYYGFTREELKYEQKTD